MDGDLLSLGDFLGSTSASLDLDTLLLAATDWPSFKLVCTFLDDMTGEITSVLGQSFKSASDEGM